MKHHITYHPGETLLHRLHPLVKAGWLFLLTAALFIAPAPGWIWALVLLALAAFRLGRLPLLRLRGTRTLALTALVLGGLHLLFNRSGDALATLGPVTLTRDGLAAGLLISGRFLAVVLMSYLFVLTTDPNALAYALMRAGLPYRYGFTLITALRLVPIFEEEARIVYEAQLARGLRYDTGFQETRDPRRFLRMTRQYFLPLLVSALGKVDALAVSMEGRCFGKHPRRTFLREVGMGRGDYVALAVLGMALAAIVLI